MTTTIGHRSPTDIRPLRDAISGTVLAPGDGGYDDARQLWNGMIDRRPAAIVRPAATADTVAALRFARERDLPLAVRGAGHNVSGSAIAEGGIVIDHGELRAIEVDPVGRVVVAAPGARLGDLDAATAAHGLVVPVGINTTTGLAGLTLGGGIGWLMRRFGLTCDHLVAAEMVLADGSVRRVDGRSDPDLLWALRGGSGNFGIVTRFEYDALPFDGAVEAGFAWYPLEDGGAVLRRYRDWAVALPRDVTTIVALRSVVDVMPGPSELKGRQIVGVGMCGPADATGERAAAQAEGLGDLLFSTIGRKPFTEHQAAVDRTVPAGLDYYWKSHFLPGLPDDFLDLAVELHLERPTDWSYSLIFQLGGAIADVASDATAFAERSAPFGINVNGVGTEPGQREAIVEWARRTFDALAPYSTGGVYVNFLGEEGEARVRAAYGPAYERLAALKARYDPDNVFRVNQNVAPAQGAEVPSRP